MNRPPLPHERPLNRPKIKAQKSWIAVICALEDVDQYRAQGWAITDLGPYHGIWSALATKEHKKQ